MWQLQNGKVRVQITLRPEIIRAYFGRCLTICYNCDDHIRLGALRHNSNTVSIHWHRHTCRLNKPCRSKHTAMGSNLTASDILTAHTVANSRYPKKHYKGISRKTHLPSTKKKILAISLSQKYVHCTHTYHNHFWVFQHQAIGSSFSIGAKRLFAKTTIIKISKVGLVILLFPCRRNNNNKLGCSLTLTLTSFHQNVVV